MAKGRLNPHDLEGLERELREEAREIDDKVYEVVVQGAVNIKRGWQTRMRARRSARTSIPHLPGAISYDIERTPGSVTAEIGPVYTKKQGPLAHLLEFGSVNNAPHQDGAAALEYEQDEFYDAIDEVSDL